MLLNVKKIVSKIGSMVEISRPLILLPALYVITVIVHILALYPASLTSHVASDEVQYALTGENIRLGNGYTLRGQFSSTIPPLYPLLVALGHSIGENPRLSFFILSVLVMSLVLIPAYLFAKELGLDRLESYILSLAAAFVPHTFYSAMYMSETLQYPLFFWAMYLGARWYAEQKLQRSISLGICLGLMALTKVMANFFALSFFLATLLTILYKICSKNNKGVFVLFTNAILVGICFLGIEFSWIMFKLWKVGDTVGHYSSVLKGSLPYFSFSIIVSYFSDLFLSSGLTVAVPLVFGIYFIGKQEFGFAAFLTLTILIMISSTGMLDGGLTGWLRERLFLYVIPVIPMLAVLGIGFMQERCINKYALVLLTMIPIILLSLIVTLYPFHVSPVIESPWAYALGSISRSVLGTFSKKKLFLSGLVLILIISWPCWLRKYWAKLYFSTLYLAFNIIIFLSSSSALASWTERNLVRLEPVNTLLSKNLAKESRLVVAGSQSYFEKLLTGPLDSKFLHSNSVLGLEESFIWQFEIMGLYDIRMSPSPTWLIKYSGNNEVFLTTTHFDGLALINEHFPYNLYSLNKVRAENTIPSYLIQIPPNQFYTQNGNRTSTVINGTGTGKSGYLVYGPYITIPAGHYSVAFKFTAGPTLPLTLDIYANGSTIALVKNILGEIPEIKFWTDGNNKLEFRIYGESMLDFKFYGVDINPI